MLEAGEAIHARVADHEVSKDMQSTQQAQGQARLLKALFDAPLSPVNANLQKRVQLTPETIQWQETRLSGLSIAPLELLTGARPRLTALMRIDPTHSVVEIPANNLEIMVQHGIIANADSEYLHPYYVRHPLVKFDEDATLELHAGSKEHGESAQIEFYVATGQVSPTDQQHRFINLNDDNLWLPGPVDNTEVMPLHMHNGNNSMLIRWLDSTQFKPRLDPLGEEVLVLSGELQDSYGYYTAGSWIRNPVEAWQWWQGCAGTVIYYKNGHFSPERA